MSEMRKWAEKYWIFRKEVASDEMLDDDNGPPWEIVFDRLARAILADTAPASQERGEGLDRFHESFDAVVWAEAFMEIVVKPGVEIDDALMRGWFANAIMRGFDERAARLREFCMEHGMDMLENPEDWLRARLRSGSEPGGVEVNPYRNGWTGEAAARPSGGEGVKWEEHGVTPSKPERWRGYSAYPGNPAYPVEWPHDPSGGEGAPEPDDRAILRRLYGAAIGNAVYPSVDWTDCATKDYRHLCDRLPPEREACSTCTEGQPPFFCRECVHRREEGLREALEREAEAREPDAMTYAKDPRRDLAEWSEVLAVRRFDPEKCKTDGSGPPWPVFFGTPGPDREAEIRADQTRKVLEGVWDAMHVMRMEVDRLDCRLSRLSTEGEADDA